MRLLVALISLGIATVVNAQQEQIPDAPQPSVSLAADGTPALGFNEPSSVPDLAATPDTAFLSALVQAGQSANQGDKRAGPAPNVPVDSNGNPIPLERQQPQRILGFMPNFRSVSGGSKPHPPGWKYNFIVATRQATDYSSFIFLGLTSITAEGMNMHPSLGKGVGGFYAYTWRGFLDKTDGTYLSAWLLPSLLHEDTRFYALGNERGIPVRVLYVISRQGVARTYGGRQTPNIAGLGGKVLTQIVSRNYYPPSATTFSVLASKFGYSVMRDVIFSSIREFYPDIAAHYIRKHREKIASQAAAGASSAP
ncbi:MAG TPA: hypothetical protein VK574_18230 [Terracidiphilus sp.]|nr:hypothetical protein [Terracidiphilus sp.]